MKADGRPYILARGDKDLVVLPSSLIPEMNRMSADMLNSRQSHAFTLLGDLTGMRVVQNTNYHVRMLLGRISPALPELFAPTASRISSAISREFTTSDEWVAFKPLPATVRCFSEGIALALFGAKMAENSRLVELTHELTSNGNTLSMHYYSLQTQANLLSNFSVSDCLRDAHFSICPSTAVRLVAPIQMEDGIQLARTRGLRQTGREKPG